MVYENIIYNGENGVGIITFNRPSARNALNEKMLTELINVMDEIDEDENIKAVIITGGEKYFCAGFDLKQITQYEGKSKLPLVKIVDRIRYFQKRIESCTRPVIAAVCGPCLAGGLEIAISCDLRVVSDTAKLGFPEIRFGGLANAGATQRLPRMIPLALAKEMHLLGDYISANEAFRIGLVNRVVSPTDVLPEAKKMAEKISNYSSPAVKLCKFLINTGVKMDVTTAMDYERELSIYLLEDSGFEKAKQEAAEREKVYAHIFKKSGKK